MPREIKTTLAVDGEAAFKRAINDANTSIRNMGTQLTLATAQFKKDGDAMKLMETRSKALKSEIEQQNEIVKALEKAVKDSSTAFGENSEKTEKWEAELNRAKARLVNLQSELTLNNAGLDRNGKAFDDSSGKAADYQATLQTIGKGVSFENITSGISRVTGSIEGAITKVFNFAKAMRDTMVDAGHWADDLMTDATKYNMDVEELQRWRNAADFIDTDVETIVSARDRLSRKMSEGWTQGSGKEKKNMWELLGIDLKDGETGQMRDQMDVMFELGETLRSMVKIDGNDVRASELAMEVFGKSYRDLLPLFNAGQDEWNRTVAEQRVVSKEHVEALGAMDDANNQLENSWETLKYTALSEIAPVLTDATNALSDLLNEFNDWMSTEEGQEAMDGLAEALRDLFSGLGDIKFKDAIETAKNALNDLKTALEWIKDHKTDVERALTVIAGGFAALKVTELALNIGKIADGFKTIFSFSGKKPPTLPADPSTPTTGTGTGAADAATGGGILVAAKNLVTEAATKAGEFAATGGAWNAGFVGDYFLHNTETGRAINPEYGGQLSLGRASEGFWKGINERIQEQLELADNYGKETYNELDPASKASYEAYQAQKQENAEAREHWAATHGRQAGLPSWAQEFQTPEELAAYMATRATAAQKEELDAYMRENPMPTQAEMNQELLNSRATLNAAPEELRTRPETPEEVLRAVGGELTEAQRAAAEEWWDSYRNDPMGDDGDEKWEALEATFGDNEALLTRLSDAIDNWLTDPGNEDDSFLNNSDLLSQAVQEMKTNTESGKTMADKVAGADFRRFNSLPAEIQAATQRGAASGVSGIVVRLDGNVVGRLVAPYVNSYLGMMAQ